MRLAPSTLTERNTERFRLHAPRQAVAARRHPLWRRALVVLAAIAVPALAAPIEWGPLVIGTAEPTKSGLALPTVPAANPAGATAGFAPGGRPIAQALSGRVGALDRTRALSCLTAAVYYEAASESPQGQRAVAQVVLNRLAHPAFPKTVCGVVYQGSERSTGCQFTFTCDGSLARRPEMAAWDRARAVAAAALAGQVEPSVGLATHYHTWAVQPAWDRQMNQLASIGAHQFFGWRGQAGAVSAFRFAYAGGEPRPGPHPRSAAADRLADPALDPLALQRAYEAALAAQAGTRASPAPAPRYAPAIEQRGGDTLYSGERLPEAQGIRPEYQNSGRWIAQPHG